MTDSANIRSLERLEAFVEETQLFRGRSLKEIENLGVELRRWSHWLEGDVLHYWLTEMRTSAQKHTEAQEALSRCMSCVRSDERRPCTEEKKRARLAQDRKRLCEEKYRISQSACRAWQRELTKIQTKIERYRDLAESDIKVALQVLEDQLETLKRYTTLSASPPAEVPLTKAAASASEPTTKNPESHVDANEPTGPSQD